MVNLPDPMRRFYNLNYNTTLELLRYGRFALRKVAPTGVDTTWEPWARKLEKRITQAQETIAGRATITTIDTLAHQDTWVSPDSMTNPAGYAGLAFNSNTRTVLHIPARTFKETYSETSSYYAAHKRAQASLDRIIRTVIADTERAAMGTNVALREGVGYVRMVQMPACSRCIMLAGRFYRWNKGFLRHPNCDCVHIPTTAKDFTQAQELGLAQDPYEAFHSLSQAQQDQAFGKYGAQAIRDGADLFQIINAQASRKGAFTTYGTTQRAYAGKRLKPGQRRILPETAYTWAKGDRQTALKLLEEHGYILPQGQIPTGALRGQAIGYGQHGKGGTARGASDAVLAALRSGVRDPLNIHTMTAAERRVFEARRDFLLVQNGVNPFSELALRLRGAPVISGSDAPLTPQIAAEVEKRFFITSQANGDVVKMRALYKDYAGVSLSTAEVEGLFALASAEQIVLQAASKKVRRVHKSVDLAEVNQRKAEALERAGTAGFGGGRKPPPPPRKRTGSSDHPEDPNSEHNKRAIRMITEAISAENAVVSFEDSISKAEFRRFQKELKKLDLSEPAMRVSLYGVTRIRNGSIQYLGGHYYYSDFINKSLFPEHWDEHTILRAVNFVRENPVAGRFKKDSITGEIESIAVRGVYDGVIIHIEWEPGKLHRPLHVYPFSGRGVQVRKRNGILKEVEFSGRDWELWRLLRKRETAL